MSGAKGLDIMKKREEEGERSANLEDKMLMNKSRREVHRARQNPRRRKKTTRSIYSSSQGAPVIKVTS
jgi:hypothetical protein